MKTLLIYLLLLANFSAGMAFALDIHPEAMVGHDVVAADIVAGDDHSNAKGNFHHNDHCCHAVAHMTGIVLSQAIAFGGSADTDFTPFSPVPKFLYISPLLRPPIV